MQQAKHRFFASFFALVILIMGSFQASADSNQFQATLLTDKILLISGPGGNTVVAIDGDELVLVDGVAAQYAEDYLEFVYQETGLNKVKVLFNTHWHQEQFGLNAILGAQGVKIVAHENTKQWLASTIRKHGDEIIHTPTPAIALPNETVYKKGSMPFADSRIDYAYVVHGHTDGDIYVFFPEENVLVTGGVVRSDDWVVMDIVTGGFLGGMLDAYEVFLEVSNSETTFVPISGPVMSKVELAEQNEMYKGVMVDLVDLLHKSQSAPEVVAANPTAGLRPDWDSSAQFLDYGFQSFFGHLRHRRHLGDMR